MEKNELPDLVMDGVNTAAGGRYHSVSINGVSKINGALSAHTYSCDGVMKQNGDLSAEELEMNGTLNLKGNLQVGGMKLNGVVNGEGSLRGERCEMDGMLKLKGNCELEELTGAGVFTVGGPAQCGADRVRATGSLGSGRDWRREPGDPQKGNAAWGRLLGGMIPKLKIGLRAKLIEGDMLDLEYTSADVVRGGTVIIGQGCSIGRVEYRTGLTVHPDAQVGKEEKIGE
ncbi:hypothetical protein ACFSQ7_19760 [Paenibacillus rhizoplanae]